MILNKRAFLPILIQGKLCRRMGDSGPFTLGNLMENYWRIVQWYGLLEVPGMILYALKGYIHSVISRKGMIEKN